jgi:hypothetical protein
MIEPGRFNLYFIFGFFFLIKRIPRCLQLPDVVPMTGFNDSHAAVLSLPASPNGSPSYRRHGAGAL